MFCYSFLAMTAYNIVKPLAGGVFIAEFGAQNLPFMILVAGPLVAVIMQGYTAVIAWLPERWVIQITQVGIVALLIGFSVVFRVGGNWLSAASCARGSCRCSRRCRSTTRSVAPTWC
tara:strand:- start:237 stop:587 length:351 start_codon:yes stop_codon:yes gene_type:complete